jgi:glycyl-tRNA synthetase
MLYFDPDIQDSYIPYVVETSVGLDRTILAVLSYGYTEETLSDGSTRVVLQIPDFLAPIKVAILPLVKKDGMNDYALNIFNDLKKYYLCQYDEKDSIGRRYRRQDAIGTPYCITVDGQTLEDNTVTIRERDSMLQDRIPVDNIRKYLHDKLNVI